MNGADLTLNAGPKGAMRALTGWTRVRFTRGIERLPSDFDIEMTELRPYEAEQVVFNPGDECQVYLGSDLVMTGYIDRVVPHITPQQHGIRVMGRGKCQDLVDCAAEWEGGQISGDSALGIAQKLAATYGITVSSDITGTPPIPQFNLMLGETPFEIIERIARYSALLAYDQPDGNLILTRVGAGKMASGFSQGLNVEEASVEYSMDQRFSEYVAFMQGVDVLSDTGGGGNQVFVARDPNVPRLRRRVLVAETSGAPAVKWETFLMNRALWESARRAGRSMAVHVTADNWRDSAGMLWTPNMQAPVSLPALKLPADTELLIGEVAYEFDERGTHAHLTLYPPSAFEPEPQAPRGAPFDVPTNPGK